MIPSRDARRLHFAEFEFDVVTRELFKAGQRLRVPDQSLEVLLTLLEHPGALVSREQLRARLWPADRFVDFEHGLNAAVRRLRDALDDSAAAPRFIETLPKRGYRFIGTLGERQPHPPPPSPPFDGDTGSSEVPPPHPSRRARQMLVVLSLLIIGLIATASYLAPTSDRTFVPSEPVLARLTFEPGLQTDPSLSPDGSLIAYSADTAGNFDIWIQPVEGGHPIQVTTDPAHDWQPDWSPDGRELVFRSERLDGGIFVVPSSGGHPRQLTNFGYRPRWSPDGAQIAFMETIYSGLPLDLHVIGRSETAAVTVPLASLRPRERLAAFAWQPDGHAIALLGGDSPDPFWLLTIDAANGSVQRWQVDQAVQRAFADHRLLVIKNQPFAWDPVSGTIYFAADSRGLVNVWSITVDSRARRVFAGPHRVTTNQDAAASVSVTRDGRRLLFGAAAQTAQLWSRNVSPDGTALLGDPAFVTSDTVHAYSPELSADGTQLAYLREHPGNGQARELVLRSWNQETERVLRVDAVDRGEVRGPPLRWSPDGSRLVYRYVQPDSPVPAGERRSFTSLQQIRMFDVQSGSESELTSAAPINDVPFGWSPDGRDVFSTGARYRQGESVIARLPVRDAPDAERNAQIVCGTRADLLWQVSVSPGGRWFVFQAESSGGYSRSRIVVAPLSGNAWREITDGRRRADKPRWSDDGRIIYYISDRGGLFNIWAQPFDPDSGVPVGTARALTAFDGPGEQILPNVGKAEMSIHAGRLVVPVIRPKGAVWMLDHLR